MVALLGVASLMASLLVSQELCSQPALVWAVWQVCSQDRSAERHVRGCVTARTAVGKPGHLCLTWVCSAMTRRHTEPHL